MEAYPTTFTYLSKTYPMPRPARPLKENIVTNVLSFSSDTGIEQRRKRGEAKLEFELSYPALVNSAYQTLKDFFVARSGKLEVFQWTHPVTNTTHLVRFDTDTFSGEPIGHAKKFGELWKVSFKLTQVL